MQTHLYKNDLDDGIVFKGNVAIDTEAMGLDPARDRLCLIQIFDGKTDCHMVQFENLNTESPNLIKLLNDETIYIDFAYSGIPEDLPIKKIILRGKPETIDEMEKDEIEDIKDEIKRDEIEDIEDVIEDIEDEIEDIENEIEDIEDELEVKEQDEQDIKERIKNVILSADQIQFGDELSEITQLVEVSEEEKKYSIDKQTKNLLNEFLSTIPNDKRTNKVLNNIHKMIERYEQLREKY